MEGDQSRIRMWAEEIKCEYGSEKVKRARSRFEVTLKRTFTGFVAALRVTTRLHEARNVLSERRGWAKEGASLLGELRVGVNQRHFQGGSVVLSDRAASILDDEGIKEVSWRKGDSG